MNSNKKEIAPPDSHQKYEVHPTAAIFPMMSNEALDELANDIKKHGLRDPVVMHDGRVIDGRNRLEGCHRAGVEPTFKEWSGTGSVVAWIASVNLHRRHLSDQQRAMLAARVAQELATEAKERSAQNLRNSGDPVDGLDPGPSHEDLASVEEEPVPEELLLLKEAHTELTKMVMAARRAERLESVSKQLRSLVGHCLKMQSQYDEISNHTGR